MRQQSAKERSRLEAGRLVAGYRNKQRADLVRRQIEMIGRGIHRKPRRPRIEMQRGAAQLAIEPVIFEHNVGGTKQFAGADAPSRTLFAAHLEQIGEVTVEQQRQVEASPPVTIILE